MDWCALGMQPLDPEARQGSPDFLSLQEACMGDRRSHGNAGPCVV